MDAVADKMSSLVMNLLHGRLTWG